MSNRTVLYSILVIQVITLVAILFNVFAARQFLGFVYLSIIPGFLIIKIFKLEKVGLVETVLFSAGVSLAFLMFFGLLLNTLLPSLGLSNPLSTFSIIASVCSIVLVLYLILCGRHEGLSNSTLPRLRFSPIVLLLIAIPFLTIFGTEFANATSNPLVLLVLVVIISLVVLGTFLKGLIPPEIYPLAIIVISFFLLFHMSLISNFQIGDDVHSEYYFAQVASIHSIWDRTIPWAVSQPYNSMLSVTILPVILSKFLNLDMNWVFKAVFPLIYMLVPLALYQAYRKLTSSLIAFLSVFFFMSFNTFFIDMLGLAREMIGELFLALLVLLILEDKIGLTKRRILIIFFSAALVVSHYSLAYIFVFFILVSFFLSRFFKRPDDKSPRVFTGSMILGVLALVLSWNLFVSPAAFETLALAIGSVIRGLLSRVPAPGVGGLLPGFQSPIHEVGAFLFFVPVFFIVVGIIGLMVKRRASEFSREYSSMSIASMAILLMCIILPSFASRLNMTRFYHIALFFLAPFCVIGGLILLDSVARLKSRFFSAKDRFARTAHLGVRKSWLFLIAVLLVCFFLFQVGFIYEVTGDVPTSISLSRDRMSSWTVYMNQLYVDQKEASAIRWLVQYRNNESRVYAALEAGTYFTSIGLIPWESVGVLYPEMKPEAIDSSYFFFDRLNIVNNVVVTQGFGKEYNTSSFDSVLNMTDKIYSNGANEVYRGYSP